MSEMKPCFFIAAWRAVSGSAMPARAGTMNGVIPAGAEIGACFEGSRKG